MKPVFPVFVMLALLLQAHAAPACVLQRGSLVVTDLGVPSIVAIDPDTADVTCTVTQGGLLQLPIGLAFAPNGDLLVADIDAAGGNGAIIRVNPRTGAQRVLSRGGYFVDPSGVTVGFGGFLYVTDPNAFGGPGGVIRVDPTNGRQTIVSAGGDFTQPINLTMGHNGRLYVTDPEAAAVLRVNGQAKTQRVVARGLSRPIGITLSGDGAVYVTDPDAFGGVTGAVFHIDPRTGKATVVASGDDFISPVAVAMTGGSLFVVDYLALIVVDPHTGEHVSHPWTDVVMPWAIAVVP